MQNARIVFIANGLHIKMKKKIKEMSYTELTRTICICDATFGFYRPPPIVCLLSTYFLTFVCFGYVSQLCSDVNKTATSSSHQDSEYDTASDSQSSDEAAPLPKHEPVFPSSKFHILTKHDFIEVDAL